MTIGVSLPSEMPDVLNISMQWAAQGQGRACQLPVVWCQSVYRVAGTVFLCWCPQKCLGTAPATAEAKEQSQWAANICSLFWRSKGLQLEAGVLLLGLWTEDVLRAVLPFYIDITVQTGSQTSSSEPCFCVSHWAGAEDKVVADTQTGCWEVECPRKGWQDCHWL